MHADRLHERHRGGDCGQEVFVRGRARAPATRRADSVSTCDSCAIGTAAPFSPPPFPSRERISISLESPGRASRDAVVRALEELTPGGIDCVRVLEVLLEERPHVAGVQVARHRLEERVVGRDRDDHADEEGKCGHDHRDAGERAVCHGHPRGDEREEDRDRREKSRLTCQCESGERERERAEEPGDVVRAVLVNRVGRSRRDPDARPRRGPRTRAVADASRSVASTSRRRPSQAHGTSGANASS